MRNLRALGELGGLAREGLGQLQVAGPGGETDDVGEEVLELDLLRDLVERARQGGERLRKRTGVLVIQAVGQRQLRDETVPEPVGMRGGGVEVAARRGDLAAMEADHGGHAEVTTDRRGLLDVLGKPFNLGQRVFPAPCLEEALCQDAMRLTQPDSRADLVREVQRLPRYGHGLLVPVQVAQRDGLVDLQQEPQVRQPRIGPGYDQRPIGQRERLGQPALYRRHQRQYVQRPAHGPGVARLLRRRQRDAGDLAGGFDLAEAAMRPGGHHQQPGAVLDG